jgi:DNA polymerase
MEKIKELSIDLETFSSIDISKCGVYKYVESPDFDILLFGVSINSGPVHVYDIACGNNIPEEILAAIPDPDVIKWAFNASFERVCLSCWIKKNHPQYFIGYSLPEDPCSRYLDPFHGDVP